MVTQCAGFPGSFLSSWPPWPRGAASRRRHARYPGILPFRGTENRYPVSLLDKCFSSYHQQQQHEQQANQPWIGVGLCVSMGGTTSIREESWHENMNAMKLGRGYFLHINIV